MEEWFKFFLLPLMLSLYITNINKLLCGRMNVTCDNCGKTFEREAFEVESHKNHFCCLKCANEWQRRNRVEITCEYCGKRKKIKPSRVSEHTFCSHECYTNWVKATGAVNGTKNPQFGKHASVATRREKSIRMRSAKGEALSEPKFELLDDKNWLYKKYWEEELNIYEIAERANCSFSSVWRAFQRLQIPMRTRSEIASSRIGEKSPRWKGGISYEPYCPKFSDELKEEVREKYGRQCFLCSKTEAENGRKLDVHHINYDKKAGCNGKRWLLIPLCMSCHPKTNSNRVYWENLIITKMRKRKLSNGQTIIDAFATLI